MSFNKNIYGIIAISILLFVATGCSKDAGWMDVEPTPAPGSPEGSSAYITFSIQVPVQTRVAGENKPQGGEDGDGSQDAQSEENVINNIIVFFYQADSFQDAIDKGATLETVEYFFCRKVDDDDTRYITETKEVPLKDGTYQMLVVANAPELTSKFRKGTPVAELGEAFRKDTWWENENQCVNFVMTSLEEKRIIVRAEETSPENPALIDNVEMQRLAARVDFQPAKGEGCSVMNSYKADNCVITLNRIKMVNRFQYGTYLLKRTATTVNGTPVYMGKETADPDKKATNYVIDPLTKDKTVANLDAYKQHYAAHATAPRTWEEADNLKTTKEAYLLGYVQENTTDKEAQLNGYSTGVILEATATPNAVINEEGGSEPNNSGIIDFYAYNGTIYKNKAAVIAITKIPEGDFTKAGVKFYKGGKMYYTYFIRHCYNPTSRNAIMEFGIVRNNVYILKVNSISSLGNADGSIDPENPDKETMIRIGTTVRPWKVLEDENIVM